MSNYTGIPQPIVAPVWELALRLRFQKPNVERIIKTTKTTLDPAIVSALIDATARRLPPDNTSTGVEKRNRRRERAKCAEDAFVASFSRLGYSFLNQVQQKKELMNVTPDILFMEPVLICGHLCRWLEFKDFFGFRANPFVAAQNKKQIRNYVTRIGEGAVVYKLGYETGYMKIPGAAIFREKEVIEGLELQTRSQMNRMDLSASGHSKSDREITESGERSIKHAQEDGMVHKTKLRHIAGAGPTSNRKKRHHKRSARKRQKISTATRNTNPH